MDNSLKKSLDDVPIIIDDVKKERSSKSKDRKEKSWDEGEVRKEKKVGRKRESKWKYSPVLKLILRFYYLIAE